MTSPNRRSPLPYRRARPTSRLCDRCQVNLDFNDKALGGFQAVDPNGKPVLQFDHEWEYRRFPCPRQIYDSFPGLPLLKASADAGCDFCRILRKALRQSAFTKCGIQVVVQMAYLWGDSSDMWGLDNNELHRYQQPQGQLPGLVALAAWVYDLAQTKNDDESLVERSVFWVSSSQEGVRNWLRCQTPLGSDVLCKENVAWIKNEIRTHELVRQSKLDQLFLPTRLIEILPRTGSVQARLILTAQGDLETRDLRYAALSYCWGPEDISRPQLKTTQSNLHRMLRSIPLIQMTAVVKDAIKVCRALSIKYLWVDALCIIQCSPQDWETESERLCDVFANSHVTICPIASESYHQGFLKRSLDQVSIGFRSRIYEDARGVILIRATKLTGAQNKIETHFYRDDPLEIDLGDTMWDERGWIFQERAFSQRLLLFGRNRVHFNYPLDNKSTAEHYSAEGNILAPRWKYWDHYSMRLGHFSKFELHALFYRATTTLSTTHFTFSSDRLPAISSLARQMFACLSDEYLSGLWKTSLHYGLLWAVVPQDNTAIYQVLQQRKSELSPQPSWSWAPTGAYHEFGIPNGCQLSKERHLQPEWDVIDASTYAHGSTCFGAVVHGLLRARGRITALPEKHTHSYATKKPELYNTWMMTSEQKYVAECNFDCDSTAVDTFYSSFRLLLVSSSCDGMNAVPTTPRLQSVGVNNSPDPSMAEVVLGSHGRGESSTLSQSSTRKLSPSDAESGQSSLNDPTESDKAMTEDDERDYIFGYTTARDTCNKCRDDDYNRHAWGLIIYPAIQQGQYYRAGIFTSRAFEAGGTKWFKDVEDEIVELI